MSLLFKGLFEFIARQLTFRILLFVVLPLCVIALLVFGRSNPNGDDVRGGIRDSLTQLEEVGDPTAVSQTAQQVIIVDDDSTLVENAGANLEANLQVEGSQSAQPLVDEQASANSVLAPQTQIELNTDLAASASQNSTTQNNSVQNSGNLEPQVTLIDSINTNSTDLDSTEPDSGTQADIDRIVIPAIDMDIPVTELGWHTATNDSDQIFSEWDVAINAAGWHKNSARPGDGGNVVMSGHNNIYGAVFRELDQLDQGDEAFVYVGDQLYTYEITQVLVVPEVYADAEQRADNAKWIESFDDDRITLVSCWPRDDNSHRIIVIGYAVES